MAITYVCMSFAPDRCQSSVKPSLCNQASMSILTCCATGHAAGAAVPSELRAAARCVWRTTHARLRHHTRTHTCMIDEHTSSYRCFVHVSASETYTRYRCLRMHSVPLLLHPLPSWPKFACTLACAPLFVRKGCTAWRALLPTRQHLSTTRLQISRRRCQQVGDY